MSSVSQRNPHGDQRRLRPTQKVIASNTRSGIHAVDRINARVALDIGEEIRSVGSRPLTDVDHDNIMKRVDQALDAAFGPTRNATLGSAVGRAIQNQCLKTGQEVHGAEEPKIVDRRMRALRKYPGVGRALLRKHGLVTTE